MDAGGLIIEVLAANAGGSTSQSNLDAWIKAPGLMVTTVMDPPGPRTTLNAFGIRETALIVDLRTMKILKKVNGSTIGAPPSSIQQMLATMLDLVKK